MTFTDWLALSAILIAILSLWISFRLFKISKKSVKQTKEFQDWQVEKTEKERIEKIKPYFEIKGGYATENRFIRRELTNIGAKAKNVGIEYGADNNAKTKLKDYKYFETDSTIYFDTTFHDIESVKKLKHHFVDIKFENMEGRSYRQLFEYERLSIIPHDPEEININ